MTAVVAALFVDERGPYMNRPDVDAWGVTRDARLYDGPLPVVAHPPCARWSQLAPLVASRGGKRIGEDEGCFASALTSVRNFGGVLEHPAKSMAWAAFGLPRPTRGGWTLGMDGGWSCCVDQSAYGHVAPKATWLYAFGVAVPAMNWGHGSPTMVVTRSRGRFDRQEMPKSQRHITPPAFVEALISLASNAARKAA